LITGSKLIDDGNYNKYEKCQFIGSYPIIPQGIAAIVLAWASFIYGAPVKT